MPTKSALNILGRLIAAPLQMGWSTFKEDPESRRTAKAYGASFTGINSAIISGALLYLGTLALILMAVTGVFGLTHLFERVGIAAVGFSDRAPAISAVINITTAIMLSAMTNVACLEAAKAKLARAEMVITQKKKAQDDALTDIAASIRLKIESQLTDEAEKYAKKIEEAAGDINVALLSAERFITKCLENKDIAEHLNVDAVQGMLSNIRSTIKKINVRTAKKAGAEKSEDHSASK